MQQVIFGISLTEWLGYFAMVLLLVSFLMKNVTKLRIINSFACALFVVYGLLIEGYPIAISNTLIIVINLYYLIFSRKKV